MSVIQKIRDKYARWAVIAIAISLLGFILMDAFAGRTGLFSNRQSTTLGKIDGKTIPAQEFAKKLADQEAYEQKQGQDVTDDRRQQLINGLWDQEVSEVVMGKQYDDLGLIVTDKELKDILFGSNPPDDLKQRFTDPKTGVFNAVAAQQFINQVKKSGTPDDKAQLLKYQDALKSQRLMMKYMALLSNSIYYPKWFLENRNSDNSLLAKASYVTVPYASVPDSTVKISDKEIEDYIKDHNKDFEQKDETRSISYVAFNAAPSATDSAAVKSQVESLKKEFAATNDPAGFLNANGVSGYYNVYLAKSKIQVPGKDSIFALPKGGVYGSYLDANTYVLAKLIDVKTLPDSVKVRHILIATTDPQSGQQIISDSLAKTQIDSIAKAIRGGANFDTLETKFSVDKAAHQTKGVMTFSDDQIQDSLHFDQSFGKFVLNGKTGDKNVIKSQFGWHYIEILDQKNPEPHYKIAYLRKQIIASQETDNAANNQATLFAGDSRDQKSFNANYDKNLRPKGFNKLIASDIKPMDFTINGIQGNARQFIKDIFDAGAGDVIGPKRVGEYNYIVAIVTDVSKPGLQSVNKARTIVEPLLIKKKKGEQIKKNIGQFNTLEQVATKVNQQVQTVDSLRLSGGNNALGYEPKVVGAVFNPENKGKVIPEALTGTQGVYVVRVDNISTTPVESANIEQQRQMMEMQARQNMQFRAPWEALKKSADIKDNRSKFY